MQTYQEQAQWFKLLMHPTRLAILDVLRDDEHCVCHMEALFGLRQAHISQHLMVLREAGLVSDRRDGWNIFYRVTKPEIFQVIDAARALSGALPSQAFTSSRSDGVACPCPKCNTGTGLLSIESPVLQDVDSDK